MLLHRLRDALKMIQHAKRGETTTISSFFLRSGTQPKCLVIELVIGCPSIIITKIFSIDVDVFSIFSNDDIVKEQKRTDA